MTNNSRIIDNKRDNVARERVPLHKQKIFEAPEKEGFKRKWVEVLPGNVERHELAGWTAVLDPTISTHDNLAHIETAMGSAITRVVNQDPLAKCRQNILMEIPIEWYNEDFFAEQNKVLAKEKEFTRPADPRKGEYGDVKIE